MMAQYGSNEWVISLWLNNDQGAQEWANEVMQSLEAELGEWNAIGEHLSTAFDEMFIEPLENELARGIFRDMINHTDWAEIAENVWVDE